MTVAPPRTETIRAFERPSSAVDRHDPHRPRGRPRPSRAAGRPAADGWRIDPAIKRAILACFADPTTRDWSVGPFQFRDRAALPPRTLADGPWRIVPGGTSIRRGRHLEADVVVMPPSYVNVGAWIGAGTMVDSHVS